MRAVTVMVVVLLCSVIGLAILFVLTIGDTMSNFLPSTDGDLSIFANKVVTVVSADPTGYGLTPEAITELTDTVNDWDASLGSQAIKIDEARSATTAKDQARKKATDALRALNRQFQGDRQLSDAKKEVAGFPVHKTTRTPAAVPTTAPVAKIEACSVREHLLKFSESNSPNSRIRPDGVTGVEIWMCCGDEAPVTDDQYQMYMTSTRMSARVEFTPEQAGKTAYYHFRYVNSRGQVGPWSMVYNATVTK